MLLGVANTLSTPWVMVLPSERKRHLHRPRNAPRTAKTHQAGRGRRGGSWIARGCSSPNQSRISRRTTPFRAARARGSALAPSMAMRPRGSPAAGLAMRLAPIGSPKLAMTLQKRLTPRVRAINSLSHDASHVTTMQRTDAPPSLLPLVHAQHTQRPFPHRWRRNQFATVSWPRPLRGRRCHGAGVDLPSAHARRVRDHARNDG